MCNLYAVTKGQQAIRDLYRAMVDRTGNLAPLPAIFPDQLAPVIHDAPEGRTLAMMRWGFPSPPGVPGSRPVTNIRNTGLDEAGATAPRAPHALLRVCFRSLDSPALVRLQGWPLLHGVFAGGNAKVKGGL